MSTTLISDEICTHEYEVSFGNKITKEFNKVVLDGELICPRCFTEENSKKLEEQTKEFAKEIEKNKLKNLLFKHSKIDDATILDATIQNYETSCKETKENKQKALDVIDRFIQGEKFNVFIQGKQGTGKSHLSYSILRAINETDLEVSTLFVSIDKMIRLIKNSFNDKESGYTEQYFIDQLSNVDFLVLDDLGAETGSIDSSKIASDFIQRVLYAVFNARQGKATIITSNISSDVLFNMYDKKIVSRMLRKPYYIIFKTAKDKRQESLPF